jgi:hypothetical protein
VNRQATSLCCLNDNTLVTDSRDRPGEHKSSLHDARWSMALSQSINVTTFLHYNGNDSLRQITLVQSVRWLDGRVYA